MPSTHEGTTEEQLLYYLVHGDEDRVVTYGRAVNIVKDLLAQRDKLQSALKDILDIEAGYVSPDVRSEPEKYIYDIAREALK